MDQRVMHDIKGDAILAHDGTIGSVQDVYFDDERWAVRYLVVDTGNWLPGRQVLISPRQVRPQAADDAIRVDLTRDQVEHAPGVEHEAPVSRILEEAHSRYYGNPYYWSGPFLWGAAPVPYAAGTAQPALHGGSREYGEIRDAEQRARESHLRSVSEVAGYAIRARDGDVGHVEDFLVDDETWAITGMVVDTRNWLPGRKVVVRPDAIGEVDWENRAVSVALERGQIQALPPV
jgi:sporulation protein YlmC with PRC-barrel domain